MEKTSLQTFWQEQVALLKEEIASTNIYVVSAVKQPDLIQVQDFIGQVGFLLSKLHMRHRAPSEMYFAARFKVERPQSRRANFPLDPTKFFSKFSKRSKPCAR